MCAVCAVLCIVLVVHACVLSCLMRAPAKTSPHKLQIHMHATSSGQEHSRTPQPQVSLRSASGQEYSHTSQDLTPHTSHLTPRTPQQTSHLAHLTRVLAHLSLRSRVLSYTLASSPLLPPMLILPLILTYIVNTCNPRTLMMQNQKHPTIQPDRISFSDNLTPLIDLFSFFLWWRTFTVPNIEVPPFP